MDTIHTQIVSTTFMVQALTNRFPGAQYPQTNAVELTQGTRRQMGYNFTGTDSDDDHQKESGSNKGDLKHKVPFL